MILTLSITIRKRSVVKKLEKFSKCAQHFKNLVYLVAREYFRETKDLKPFCSLAFLEKYVKGKEILPIQNEKIEHYQKELVKLWKDYLGSDTVNTLTNQLAKEFRSILGKWKNGSKSELPKPRKLDKLYSFVVEVTANMLTDKRKNKRKNSSHLVIRLGKSFGAVRFKIPKSLTYRHLKLKWDSLGEVTLLINYDVVETKSEELNEALYLSIDLGLNNLLSVISNKENIHSFLIEGKSLKALNQWINKLASKLQSEGKQKELRQLWNYRKKRIDQIFGTISNFLVALCLKERIGTLILSKSLLREFQKEGKNGKRFNQTFRFLPLGKLVKKIEYKAKLAGVKVLIVPEEYTSKVSAISGNIEVLNKNQKDTLKENGKRIKRGLFKDLVHNKVWNADLNGALNIAIRALGSEARKSFLSLKSWLDKLARPKKLYLRDLTKYPASLFLEEIAGSNSLWLLGQRRRTLGNYQGL